ncbi:MAG: flagellar motor protein MotB [Candidatus Fimenecus sp.]
MCKKITAVLLAVAIIFSFAACKKDGESKKEGENKAAVEGGYMLKNKESVELEAPANPLNPQSVYDSLTYSPKMFYGEYRILKSEEESFADTVGFMDYKTEFADRLSILPYYITAGRNSLNYLLCYATEYEWMSLKFKTDSGYMDELVCAYSVEGNRLILKPLKSWSGDKETQKITYEFTGDTLEYEFSFKGPELTLSKDGKSVTMHGNFWSSEDIALFSADHYVSKDSNKIDNIDRISFRYDGKETVDNSYITFSYADGNAVYNAIGHLSDDGLFTFTIPYESGTKTYQFVYFYCGSDGIVLTDGTNTYYYNATWTDRNQTDLKQYISEDNTGKVDKLSEAQLKEIVEKKNNLLDDLAAEFQKAGISVTVNAETGELAMDSSVLFGGDSAELTAEGKEFLNKFIGIYTSIVFSDKYNGFISKTMVEGHTAPVSGSTYEGGLPLSQERAENVKNYCLSAESGVDAQYLTVLSANMESVGYSNSKPVKDANGNIDMDASRRVSFRFIINLDNA